MADVSVAVTIVSLVRVVSLIGDVVSRDLQQLFSEYETPPIVALILYRYNWVSGSVY